MTTRRGHGEGSITRRADGRWMGRLDLGRGIDGRRRRKTIYGATERDVVQAMKGLHGRDAQGLVVATSTPTVAAYLAQWVATNCETWKPATRRSYQGAIDGHLVPAFGPLRLEQLTPSAIQVWLIAAKTAHGARRRIELAHATLRSALSDAVRLQLLAINPAKAVKVPKAIRREIAPLTIEDARRLLAAADTHRLGPLFSVALACGLRLGEATGLRWEDVDLETGDVQIVRQLQAVGGKLELQPLKTTASRRALILPRVCLDALRRHRTSQREDRLKAGAQWVETGLVFATYAPRGERRTVGAGLHPRNVTRVLSALLQQAGIARRRFHDLRHSAASLLIASGVELVEVSKLLGHSEVRLTADLYGHLLKPTAAKAATVMDAVLNG